MSTPVATHPMRWEADPERRVAWFPRLLDSGHDRQRSRTHVHFPDPTDPPLGRPAPGHDPTRQWGTGPTPPGPKRKRRGPILLAATIGLAVLIATVTGSLPTVAPSTMDPLPPQRPPPTLAPADRPDDGSGGGSEAPSRRPSRSRSRSRRQSRSPS
jgi:hypothetical protein